MIVSLDTTLQVGDHDFSQCSLTPSVSVVLKTPETIDGNWYDGEVTVCVKDSIFQPSSPTRHAVEMAELIQKKGSIHPVILIYSDGGPDHRCTYLSVMLTMVYIWLRFDCDLLVLARTPPGNSWKNPAERTMSQLNIALQATGMAREACVDSDKEKLLKR